MWRNLKLLHIWHVYDVENVFTYVHVMLFCLKIGLLWFTLFCCEICFVAICALLCGEKWNQILHMWRKNDKYQVWACRQIFWFSLSRLPQARATTVPLNCFIFKIQNLNTKPNGFYNTSKSINQSNGAKGTHLPKKIYMNRESVIYIYVFGHKYSLLPYH